MGGMVLETNMNEIVAQVEMQNRMEKSEVSVFRHDWDTPTYGCTVAEKHQLSVQGLLEKYFKYN